MTTVKQPIARATGSAARARRAAARRVDCGVDAASDAGFEVGVERRAEVGVERDPVPAAHRAANSDGCRHAARNDQADRAARSGRTARAGSHGRAEHGGRAERSDRAERTRRADRGDHNGDADHNGRAGRNGHADANGHADRNGRAGRNGRADGSRQAGRNGQADGNRQAERNGQAERAARNGRARDPRRDRRADPAGRPDATAHFAGAVCDGRDAPHSRGRDGAEVAPADRREPHTDRAGNRRVVRARGAPRERSCEQLLSSYRRRPTIATRNLLVERHRGFVESMARRLAGRLPRSVDVDDLVHAGVWGLMRAIEKFRADRGTPFLLFMRSRVRGAMLDELRNMDFLPRLYRQRLRARDAAVARLRGLLEREPSDAEIAGELGVSEQRLHVAYARLLGGRAGQQGADGEPDALESVPDQHESPLEAIHRQDVMRKIEACLQPIEWTVLRLHYLEGKSGREVASQLRLSASRVCQIHVRVLSKLKSRLERLG